MLSGEGPINPQTTFSLLLEVLEINKIKPKKASKPQFYPIIPPQTHSSMKPMKSRQKVGFLHSWAISGESLGQEIE